MTDKQAIATVTSPLLDWMAAITERAAYDIGRERKQLLDEAESIHAALAHLTKAVEENAALKAEVERLRVEHDLTVKHMASDYNKLVDDLGKAEAWAKKLSDSHNGLEAKWRKNGAIIIEQMVENDRLRKMAPIANVQLSGDAEYWKARAENSEAVVEQNKALIADLTRDMNEEYDRALKAEAEVERLKDDLAKTTKLWSTAETDATHLYARMMKAEAELEALNSKYKELYILFCCDKAELDAARPTLQAINEWDGRIGGASHAALVVALDAYRERKGEK